MGGRDLLVLAREFAALAGQIRTQQGVSTDSLDRLVKAAASHVDGCTWASISDHRARTLACTDPIAAHADRLQHELGEGPCWQAALDGSDYFLLDVLGESG